MKEIIYTVTINHYSTYWYLNGECHRTNGPAAEWNNGYKAWYLNGKSHRTGGPAIKYSYGYKLWYLNGKQYDPNNRVFKISSNSSCFLIHSKR